MLRGHDRGSSAEARLPIGRERNTAGVEVSAVLLNGVEVEGRVVLQLARLVDSRLATKLVTAYRLKTPVVALSPRERDAVLAVLGEAALDPSAPRSLRELEAAVRASDSWRLRQRLD
jgi:hypothetical protein